MSIKKLLRKPPKLAKIVKMVAYRMLSKLEDQEFKDDMKTGPSQYPGRVFAYSSIETRF